MDVKSGFKLPTLCRLSYLEEQVNIFYPSIHIGNSIKHEDSSTECIAGNEASLNDPFIPINLSLLLLISKDFIKNDVIFTWMKHDQT